MFGNLDFNVEQNLAWKYLLTKINTMKKFTSFSHPVGWDKLNDKIAVQFLPRKTNRYKIYSFCNYDENYTDDKIIDKLFILGTFSKDGSTDVCKLTIKSKGNFKAVI